MYMEVLLLLTRCVLSQIVLDREEVCVPLPSPGVGSAHRASI